MGISSLFNIGNSALTASQANIATTGNNIANVNTPGYNRQYVRLEDAYALNMRPGAQGQGVNAAEVMRRFNKFLESSYLDKASTTSRWETQYNSMSSVENIFNESNRTGISTTMVSFFKGWQDMGLRPEDPATRQSLLSYADNLTLLMRQSTENLKEIQRQMDLSIKEDVTRANDLIKAIADMNKQITMSTVNGVSNPNGLMDKRDLAVRELAQIMDVSVTDNGGGDYSVRTKSGHTLVQGSDTFELQVLPPRSESNKVAGSTYGGNIRFDGLDTHEYTVEMVNGGDVGDVPPPSYRVSLDGGKAWLKGDNGQEMHFEVTDADGDGNVDPVQVKNLKISFDQTTGFTTGDRFIIMPKDGLYWIEPTRGPQNITPQVYFDGTDNNDRLMGGSLTSFFNVRDDNCGRYLDELDAMAKSLIWEVNRLHSQGSGLEYLSQIGGTYGVYPDAINQALGHPQSGLFFGNKLTSGNLQVNIYNKETGDCVNSGPLDFGAGAGIQNFDPAVHSLQDVADAINRSYPGVDAAGNPTNMIHASIQDGKLSIEANPAANPPVEFAFGTDTTGLLAGLGINTFFQGTGAANIAVNTDLHTNTNRISAGAINGANELNPGDNSVANAIGKLLTQPVSVSTPWRTTGNQSLSEYYSALVSKVGADTRTAKTNAQYNAALTADLDARQASISGVNIDEEMASLIKFQHSYTAAAKLITTADQMLQTLLGLKQ